jgi:hypothetical protein
MEEYRNVQRVFLMGAARLVVAPASARSVTGCEHAAVVAQHNHGGIWSHLRIIRKALQSHHVFKRGI